MDQLKWIQYSKSDTPVLSQYHGTDTKWDCSIQLFAEKCPTTGLLQEEVGCWQYPDLKKKSHLSTHRDYARIEISSAQSREGQLIESWH